MKGRELGVLSDMPDIKKKACLKLFKQQVFFVAFGLEGFRFLMLWLLYLVSLSLRC